MKSCFIVMSLLAVLVFEPTVQSWDFEDVAEGKLPEGWKVEATGQSEPTATWKVIKYQEAPLVSALTGGRVSRVLSRDLWLERTIRRGFNELIVEKVVLIQRIG